MITNNSVRVVFAFLLTPIFAVFVVPAVACVSSLIGSRSCDVDVGWAPVFLGVAFGATAIAGVPLYFALQRFGMHRWWQYGLVGTVVGLVAAVIVNAIDRGFSWYGLSVVIAPIGFISGVLFWLLGTPKHSKVSAATVDTHSIQ